MGVSLCSPLLLSMKICVYDKIANKPLNPFSVSFLVLILAVRYGNVALRGGGRGSGCFCNNVKCQLTIGCALVCCVKVLAKGVNAFWSYRMTGYK